MSEFLTEINYDKLIEKSLKNVVVEALKIAERQGLPGDREAQQEIKRILWNERMKAEAKKDAESLKDKFNS